MDVKGQSAGSAIVRRPLADRVKALAQGQWTLNSGLPHWQPKVQPKKLHCLITLFNDTLYSPCNTIYDTVFTVQVFHDF